MIKYIFHFPEIMLFEGKVTDYKDYDYVKPTNFLRVDAGMGNAFQVRYPNRWR